MAYVSGRTCCHITDSFSFLIRLSRFPFILSSIIRKGLCNSYEEEGPKNEPLKEKPVDGEYEPEKYGVPLIGNVDLDVLSLFTSRTDKACLGDLLNSN